MASRDWKIIFRITKDNLFDKFFKLTNMFDKAFHKGNMNDFFIKFYLINKLNES